ncbi:MAG: transcriptional regulator, GntR family [Microbacteriaceae bacterium]|jgi:GntR family transcriptional regulator of gluconate operon|nr:transcriptional regulator, GntR family [Microbacteriaceae bacterium]
MSNLLASNGRAIPQAQELGQQVLEQLRVLIITGELPHGTHLVEAQLSASFDVSRGPVRDALNQLETEGLVESRRRGVFVAGLSTEDIDELYSLRETMELMAIRESARREYSAQWALAEGPLAQMKRAAEQGDYATFARADLAFHGSFYDIAGHRRLQKIWQQYEPTFAVLLTLTTAEDIDLLPSYESHVEIHQHMQHGELDRATVSLQEHLLGSRNRLVSAYARLTKVGQE